MEREIVRLTSLYQHSTITPVLRHLFVAATCKVAGELIQFQRYVGDLWNAEHDKNIIEKSIALQEQIAEECQRLGLTVRAGMDKEAGDAS